MQMMFWRRGEKWRRCFLVLLLLGMLIPAFFASGALAAGPESPISDVVFGQQCPLGMCTIPNGFLLSYRDKAMGVHFTDENKEILGLILDPLMDRMKSTESADTASSDVASSNADSADSADSDSDDTTSSSSNIVADRNSILTFINFKKFL